MIKLDYYFSVIYCTLTSDEIENLPESNNSFLTYDILCGEREKVAATLNKFNSDNYTTFKITEFILPERKIVFYEVYFLFLQILKEVYQVLIKIKTFLLVFFLGLKTKEIFIMKYYYVIIILLPKYKKDIYSLVILIFLNHLIFIGMTISISLLILCLIKIVILFKSLLIVIY